MAKVCTLMGRMSRASAMASLLCHLGGCASGDSNSVPPSEGVGGATGNQSSAPLVEPPDQLLESSYDWDLPPAFSSPWEPSDNPTTPEKVELGRHLFYDERLSRNGSQSCASCHRQELAFTDGRAVSIGSTGERHTRSAMSLANVGYASTLTWGNPLLTHLERQALTPLFGESPVEMGLKDQSELPEILSEEPKYEKLFTEAFGESESNYSVEQVTKALAAFQRTLLSGNSAFDRWAYQGEEQAMSESAQRGYTLFRSEKMECFHCHGGPLFSDHTHYSGKSFFEAPYHNTGLYDVDGKGGYPEPNFGIYEVTLIPAHMGKHKAPTLRNIAVTAPYMHDGSIATLNEVLDHYAAGGRTIDNGEKQGDGAGNPYKDGLIRPIDITQSERADLIAFLESLTDQAFLTNPKYSNPWPH